MAIAVVPTAVAVRPTTPERPCTVWVPPQSQKQAWEQAKVDEEIHYDPVIGQHGAKTVSRIGGQVVKTPRANARMPTRRRHNRL
jgi:hypothetical protein